MPVQKKTTFPFNSSVSLKTAALIYAGEGFSIIPLHWISGNQCSCGKNNCASPAKHPLLPHGLKEASNDIGVIENWWQKFPKANIGVCTGTVSNGLTVVDIDTKKGGSVIGLDLPNTLEVETGAGFHFWYRSDQDIRNSAGKLGQGIDIRGSGGYVVAPPSVHYTGHVYSFRNEDPIAEFSGELLTKLTAPESDSEVDSLTLSCSPDIADFVSTGGRNDFLTSIGGKLRRHGFSPIEIESTLITTNLNRCSPPLTDKEVRRIARSVGRYSPVEQLDTGIADLPDFAEVPEHAPEIDQAQTDQNQEPPDVTTIFSDDPGKDPLIGAITTKQLRTTVYGKPEMVLQGLFKKDWGLVVGIGSVGKSTFLFNACIALACGRPFLPIIPEGQPPRKILYLDFEGSEWRSQQQLEIMCEVLTELEIELVDENLHWGIEPEVKGAPWKLNDRQSLINLGKYVKQHNIDLIVIDTASQAVGLKDENSNGEVQRSIVVPIRRFCKHFNVCALLVHHEGRGKEQNKVHNTQYRTRGATALPDASRYQIAIIAQDQDKRGPVDVVNAKNKGYGFDKSLMNLDEDTRWFSLINPPLISKIPKLEDSILEVLESNGGEMAVNEVFLMLPGVSQGAVRNSLSNLRRLGKVTNSKKGVYQRSTPS